MTSFPTSLRRQFRHSKSPRHEALLADGRSEYSLSAGSENFLRIGDCPIQKGPSTQRVGPPDVRIPVQSRGATFLSAGTGAKLLADQFDQVPKASRRFAPASIRPNRFIFLYKVVRLMPRARAAACRFQ